MAVPSTVVWVRDILWALPAPTDTWVDLIGKLVWPAVTIFFVLRFRSYIRRFLNTLLERLKTDHVKTPLFELTPNAPVINLDPEGASDSTENFDADDIQRIEAIFTFMGTEDGWAKIWFWLNKNFDGSLDIEDFVTKPEYATERERAFNEIEGLKI